MQYQRVAVRTETDGDAPRTSPDVDIYNGQRKRSTGQERSTRRREYALPRKQREKGKEEHGNWMFIFSESCGCTASSNDQRTRSNQASAPPEIYIKKQVNTQSKTYEEATSKKKLTQQSAVLTQNLKESRAALQKTQTSRNVIGDIKNKIEIQYRQAQSLVDKNREHEKVVLNLLVNTQETSTKLTSVSMNTKTVADQFTAWMKTTTKDSKNGIRNEYNTTKEEFTKLFNSIISEMKSKHKTFNAAYSTDTAKLYARTHAKAEA